MNFAATHFSVQRQDTLFGTFPSTLHGLKASTNPPPLQHWARPEEIQCEQHETRMIPAEGHRCSSVPVLKSCIEISNCGANSLQLRDSIAVAVQLATRNDFSSLSSFQELHILRVSKMVYSLHAYLEVWQTSFSCLSLPQGWKRQLRGAEADVVQRLVEFTHERPVRSHAEGRTCVKVVSSKPVTVCPSHFTKDVVAIVDESTRGTSTSSDCGTP